MSADPTVDFVARHIGPSVDDQRVMLAELGVASLEELIDQAVPASIRSTEPLALGPGRSEVDVIERLREFAAQNQVRISLIGLGYSNTITPAVIQRNILENPAWYTAYTPYQPEISQGRLEAILNFQTMVADISGREIANASLLDEATAAAEAMTLLHRVSRTDHNRFLVDIDTLPQTIAVLATRAEPLGIELVIADPDDPAPDDVFGVLLAYPGASGRVRDLAPLIAAHHDGGRLVAVATDLLACCLLTPPGDSDADVVVGSAQRFGVPLGFGGPHAGFMAIRDEYRRSLPGRLVGVSVDDTGLPALRLALQTREQHIRRERATSNICTAQVLLAVMAGAYGTYHGPDGLRAIARRVHERACQLAAGLDAAGIVRTPHPFFDTVIASVPRRANAVLAAAADRGIDLRLVDEDTIAVSVDETTTPDIVTAVLGAFGTNDPAPMEPLSPLSLRFLRTSEFCEHPVFSQHRSETAMLRYLRRLADRDLALDRTMIPLGSCTMKLNATTEMLPVSWPEFASIHPFAPAESTVGYRQLIDELEVALCAITGYDAVSLQPNAGSQGELAGLLAIRGYHRANGDDQRGICLIPQSAHGTNAASASMAGMRVVVIECEANGDVDLDDLEKQCIAAGDCLGAIMVTYPSTHGVFEARITEICDLVHRHGGQVYVDGANLNAMVGLARPGRFGADVSHLNLHKTFCIPHGGGGPGVGPVAVRSHLAPYLPNHPLVEGAGPSSGVGPVAAAPWGSASILPISWAYIALMGGPGLTEASRIAILSANYIAHRLADRYPILYTGAQGRVAHECIIDLRRITKETGITVDDVAKRLIDFGFHAPTMSFPVPGTLMIEPTESEDLTEIDRFVDAMLAIRGEIDRVAAGEWPVEASPLARAPHTAAAVTADQWDRPYSRFEAAYPTGEANPDKYWPPVGRIDGAFGDKNLMCSCPPMDHWR